jgi:P2-related tail formation protein
MLAVPMCPVLAVYTKVDMWTSVLHLRSKKKCSKSETALKRQRKAGMVAPLKETQIMPSTVLTHADKNKKVTM